MDQNDLIDMTVQQLHDRANALDRGDEEAISSDDIRAVANILAQQQVHIEEAIATAGRAVLVAQIARTFALTELHLPKGQLIQQFLRDYIDEGRWGPIPWPPEDITSLTRFLRDQGYANIDGLINRPAQRARPN